MLKSILFILLLFSLSVVKTKAQVNLANGLVAYYPFNGNFNDASGNGLHGVGFSGVTFTADKFNTPNSAVTFDGIDDFIEVRHSGQLGPRNAFSFVVQFKTPNLTRVQTLLARRERTSEHDAQFQVFTNWTTHQGAGYAHDFTNNTVCNSVITLYNSYVSTGANTVKQNTWHCLIGTFDGTTQKIYLDGALMQSKTTPTSLMDVCRTIPMTIGKYLNGTTNIQSQMFQGDMDEIRIYNRALNTDEVSTLCPSPYTLSTPFFTAPDTVCINNPITIQNQSTNASSYYWNFCVGDVNTPPTGTNIGNPGSNLRTPVFMDYVYDNGNYYGFVVNHNPGGLIRLNFGNSLLNTPTSTDLGNFGGMIPNSGEGIQVVKNQGRWYAIIVAGFADVGMPPRVLKVDFGTDLNNPSPAATNWGNIGNMSQALDLVLFQHNGNWHGLTINGENNTLTRIDFTNSFNATPTAVNLGNIGGLQYPSGCFAVNDNGEWKIFVTNAGSNNVNGPSNYSLTRLDFGSNLTNTPVGTNLGSLGGILQHPRDLTIIKTCDQAIGYLINGRNGYNQLIKLDFNKDLNSVPVPTVVGNTGGLSFPHSISKIFRVENDLYSFITNANNSTITRLQFPGCNNATIPSTTAQNPPPFTYNQPGTYNISLTVDDGLPTQASYCKPVVVLPAPAKNPIQQVTICPGQTITLQKNLPANITYAWSTGETTNAIDITTTGIYWVDMTRFGCTTRDTFNVVNETADFSFLQDACNPLQVTFHNQTPQTTSIAWDFGNGNTNTTDNTATVMYNAFNTYTVSMQIITANGCNLQVQKQMLIDITTDSLIINRDTTLCENSTLQLNSLPALSYCWFPATGLSATNIANPIAVNPAVPTTYYLHTQRAGTNLIVNGDFSQGNTGFSSSYTYNANSGWDLGTYNVSNNIAAWHQYFASCGDHTGNGGNMLMANGITSSNTTIWEQTISVSPNTNYHFSGWLQSLQPVNPATIQLYINNTPVGNPFTGVARNCQWEQFSTSWNAGNTSTATLRLVNNNINAAGNDFALDDLSFAEVIIYRDSITLQTEIPVVTASVANATICENDDTELNATGALTYSWSPASTLNNTQIVNPIATPDVTTTYTVTGTTIFGCTATDQVTVQVNPAPVISSITPDTVICKNSSLPLVVNSNGSGFIWTNAATLNNPAIYNPIATPVQNSTKYIVTVTDAINCSSKDSVTLTWRPDPVFTINAAQTICDRDTISLNASGGERFNWQPAATLSNQGIASPKAFPNTTTTYMVTITDTACNNVANLSTTVTVNPVPEVTATKDNDLDCSFGSTQLKAQGAIRYNWTPATGLNRTNIANPIASPVTPMQYVVTGYNRYGCADTATVQLQILTTNKGDNLMPNAFTPNGDGHNDCYGIKYWGVIENVEFSIFNRWGQRVFYSNKADGCWDGNFKGVQQAAGAYVYMVTAVTNCGNITRKGTFVLIR